MKHTHSRLSGDPGGTPYRQDEEARGRKGMRASSISSLLSSALGATICSRLSPPLGVDLQVAGGHLGYVTRSCLEILLSIGEESSCPMP